jgi:glutamine amidotransferase
VIAIIDYQAGNQTSVRRALTHLGIESEISAAPEALARAKGIIFPGVGAAGQAMAYLRKSGLDAVISDLLRSGRPFLGLCLGCQIMLDSSEENDTKTLGILRGRNVRFNPETLDEAGRPIRIPHMGWNNVSPKRETALLKGLTERDQFYFVHGYYPLPAPEYVLAATRYGVEFASVFGREGLWAVQFHPEKSGPSGLRLLSNFYEYCLARAN